MSDGSKDSAGGVPRESASESIRKAGSVAYQSLLAALVLGLLLAVTGVLAFFVYRGVLSPEPFLLLLGIFVGFCLGRLDALL